MAGAVGGCGLRVPPAAQPPATGQPSPIEPSRKETAERPPAKRSGLRPGEAAALTWHPSTTPRSGDLSTKLPNGDVYRGHYDASDVGVVVHLPSSLVISPSGGWQRSLAPAGDDEAAASPRPPRVVSAELTNADGDAMRCFIWLRRARLGASAGGEGYCRLASGERIEARLR